MGSNFVTAADLDGACSRLNVTVAELGGRPMHVVSVGGEFDLHSAPELQERLATVSAAGSRRVIVDLTDLRFIDSASLGVLVQAAKRLRATGGELVLVCDDRRILRVLEVTGVLPMFRIETGLTAAVNGAPIRPEAA